MRLAVDDVVEGSKADHDAVDLDSGTATDEFIEDPVATGDREVAQDVHGTGVGGPGAAAECPERGSVDDHWELARLRVG